MLLGLEVGLDAARAVAIDGSGAVMASAEEAYPLDRPRPGWMEQDPADWWGASKNVMSRLMAGARGEPIALGVTGQMRGSVFLDDRGNVVRPAILGGDQRAASQAAQIAERLDSRVLDITGNQALSGFQAPAILWLRDVEPVQYRHTARVLLPKDYVRLMLTDDAATDASDASGTLLFDVGRRAWSDEILAAIGIPAEWLPRVLESPVIAGGLRGPFANELGLPADLPIAAGAGDLAATAVAGGVVGEARIGSCIGSRGLVMATMQRFMVDSSGRPSTWCHAVPGSYLSIATTLTAGSSLRWWRDVLGSRSSLDELTRMAESVPPGSEGLFFVLTSGDRPSHVEPTARGAFVGLRAHHTAAHLTRALMEGVVFSLRDGLDRMRKLGIDIREIRASGGGTRSALWTQMQADVLHSPVVTVPTERGPAYGAALIAGVAVGEYPSVAEAAARVEVTSSAVEPDAARTQRYEAIYQTYAQLSAALQQEIPAPGQKLLQSSTRGVAQPG